MLRGRGEEPVAVSCDAIQVYRGLETLAGRRPRDGARAARAPAGRLRGGERGVQRRPVREPAHAEIDELLAEGRRPIVVGGTGLYLRAALAELELRPPVPAEVRGEVEREIAARGPEALHAELDPDVAATVHPNDRKRIARLTELQRAGIEPPRAASSCGPRSCATRPCSSA